MRAALVGAGAIAREHLSALAALPHVEVVGLCDLSEARAEATAERFGVPRAYTALDRMLRETNPDLVHVTTPAPTHFTIARDCLRAGHSVLCEKPITTEYGQLLELRRLASERGRLLLEDQNCRFDGTVRRITELVATGELGEVVDVDVRIQLGVGGPASRFADPNAPHPCLALRGGAIADFLPHLAYLAIAFAGEPRRVRTLWAKRAPTSPLPRDELRAIYEGERAFAALAFSANGRPSGFWLRVRGTRLEAETNLFEPPRLVLRRGRPGVPAVAALVDGLVEARDVFEATLRGFWRKLGGVSTYDGLRELLARTYGALERGEPPPVSPEEIDACARTIEALLEGEAMR